MEFAIQVILPMAQAFIMFSLGLSLTVDDFIRVFRQGKVLAIGVVCQVLILPIIAFGVVLFFDLPPVLAAGTMLLAFCPGGVSSNVISQISKGDLALAVSLTTFTGLIAFVTVPPLAAMAILYFMGEAAPEFSILGLSVFTFILTTVPVMTGVFVRHILPRIAIRLERPLNMTAVTLWALLVLFLFAGNWELLLRAVTTTLPALLTLPILLMLLGWSVGRLMGVSRTQSKTLSIETSIQNSPLGVALAGAIMGPVAAGGLSELSYPAGLYSLTMYIVALPAVLMFRRMSAGPADIAAQAAR